MLHFPSHFNQSLKGLLGICFYPFLVDDVKDGDDVDKVLLNVPIPKSGHLEIASIRHLDLDFLSFLLLV